MKRKLTVLIVLSVLLGAAVWLGDAAFVNAQGANGVADAQSPADSGAGYADPDPQSGFFGLVGGPAKRKYVRTQTAASTIPECTTAGCWFTLPGAVISGVTVATGARDLLNVSFSSECRISGTFSVNGGFSDFVRIRVIDNGVPIEPSDLNQAFCQAPNNTMTTTGTWSKYIFGGAHTIAVQFQIVDNAALGAPNASIDDWTFEAVQYE